jgi:hypothetical protein
LKVRVDGNFGPKTQVAANLALVQDLIERLCISYKTNLELIAGRKINEALLLADHEEREKLVKYWQAVKVGWSARALWQGNS